MPRAPPAGKRTGFYFRFPFPVMPTNVTTTGSAAQQTADLIFDAVFERSLDFQIKLDFDQTCRFIRRINSYNAFEWGHVLDALDHVDRLIPRSNGHRDYTLKIGREGSPVLYLDRIEFGSKESLTDAWIEEIFREMRRVALADEADATVEPIEVLNGRHITFRFWWD